MRPACTQLEQEKEQRGGYMLDRVTLMQLLCVALVAALMLPLGQTLFPYVSHELTGIQFQAIEAVVSATLGFGISSIVG